MFIHNSIISLKSHPKVCMIIPLFVKFRPEDPLISPSMHSNIASTFSLVSADVQNKGISLFL